jgi:hypothetical protein
MPDGLMMSRDEVSAFIDREFPQIHHDGCLYHIEEVGPLSARAYGWTTTSGTFAPAVRCPARR